MLHCRGGATAVIQHRVPSLARVVLLDEQQRVVKRTPPNTIEQDRGNATRAPHTVG